MTTIDPSGEKESGRTICYDFYVGIINYKRFFKENAFIILQF